MYKGVIFDLDGTLLNTLDDLANAGNYALSEKGYAVHETEKYKYFIGNGIPKLIQRIVPEGTSEEETQRVYELFCSYYHKHMNDCTAPYAGVEEVLKKLKDNDVKTVVVTNKVDNFAKEIVDKYFGGLIDEVYGSVEGLPKKPDPYWTKTAMAALGLKNEQILYVGDSGVDMQTAINSDLTSCGVLWGFRSRDELEENGADYIAENCSDLTDIIFGFIKK